MSPGPSDSAGQPWSGRQFTASGPDDDGSAPALLMDAIGRFRASAAVESEVVDAFRESRLLIPLVSHLGEAAQNADGHPIDKTQELGIVTVAGPDGRTVLPVFSSVAAMQAWDRSARPIPADGVRVALAAAGEHTDLVVIDPGSDTQFAIRRPALWAIAQSLDWMPSHADPDVRAQFQESASQESVVRSVALAAGDPEATLSGPELVVRLGMVPGLSRDELDAVIARLQTHWSASAVIADRVDSLAVQLNAEA